MLSAITNHVPIQIDVDNEHTVDMLDNIKPDGGGQNRRKGKRS